LEAWRTSSLKRRWRAPGDSKSWELALGLRGGDLNFCPSSGVGMMHSCLTLSLISPSPTSTVQIAGPLGHCIPMPRFCNDCGVINSVCDKSLMERRREFLIPDQCADEEVSLMIEQSATSPLMSSEFVALAKDVSISISRAETPGVSSPTAGFLNGMGDRMLISLSMPLLLGLVGTIL